MELPVLGMKTYSRAYIDASRARVEDDVAAYRKLAAAVRKQPGCDKSLAAFETTFFNDMLLVLDRLFVHRLRMVEGKDTNALSEVRVLSNAMVHNGGTMIEDKAVKSTPERSVLMLQSGDAIRLTEAQFAALSSAFFGEIDRKFNPTVGILVERGDRASDDAWPCTIGRPYPTTVSVYLRIHVRTGS